MTDEEHVRYEDGTVGQVDGQRVPRYAGLTTFARLPRIDEVDDFGIAVIGVPFDATVTYRPGARFGPSHIRQASRLLRPYNPAQDHEPFRAAQVVDAGDVVANPFHIQDGLAQIEAGVSALIGEGGRGVVCLGGDHTLALPALRAAHRAHGPLALVHFDSHLDTWGTYFDEPFTHGTPFRHASEEGLIVKGRSAHVGIRGPLYGSSDLADDAALGYTIVSTREVARLGTDEVIARILQRVGDAPVYVSVDIDVLDPAFAPGTGIPEAGGLSTRELLELLRGLAAARVVAADIVEVAPAYDHAEITGIAAATIAYELVSVIGRGRRT